VLFILLFGDFCELSLFGKKSYNASHEVREASRVRKKIYRVISLVIFVLFSGCNHSVGVMPCDSHTIHVMATTSMLGDLLKAIGGERVVVDVLIRGEADPHSYELVKGDDERLDSADLLVCTGLNLEHGASLQAKIAAHAHTVNIGAYFLREYRDLLLWEDGQIDPHVWMDVSLWTHCIEPMVEALCSIDPEGVELYRERGECLKTTMQAHHAMLKERIQAIPSEKRYLVTSHDAFGYFARGYLATSEEVESGTWKQRFCAPEGLSPDGQLSVMHLRFIIDHLAKYKITTVFPELNVSRDSLRKIIHACRDQHVVVRFSTEPLYGDCMGVQGSLGDTYLGMMEHNILVLIREWSVL